MIIQPLTLFLVEFTSTTLQWHQYHIFDHFYSSNFGFAVVYSVSAADSPACKNGDAQNGSILAENRDFTDRNYSIKHTVWFLLRVWWACTTCIWHPFLILFYIRHLAVTLRTSIKSECVDYSIISTGTRGSATPPAILSSVIVQVLSHTCFSTGIVISTVYPVSIYWDFS